MDTEKPRENGGDELERSGADIARESAGGNVAADECGKIWKKRKESFFDNYSGTNYSVFVQFIVIFFTSVIRAIAYDVFIIPNKIAPGGIAGISSILYNINSNLSVGITSAVMNVPLVVMAFLFINKKFAISTMIAVAVTSVLTDVMEMYHIMTFTGDLFVAGFVGGMLNGVALGFLLKINSSTGGTDIMGLLIQNKMPEVKISWIIFLFNAVVTMAAGIVFKSISIAIYSLISVFATSFATDFIQKGFVSSVEFKIFTTEEKERMIADYVIKILGHSVTKLPGMGMYRCVPRSCLICVVRKRQATMLKKAITEIDPEAFFYISSVSTVLGKGFFDNNVPRSKL